MAEFPSQVDYGSSHVKFDPAAMHRQGNFGAAKTVSADELVRLATQIKQEAAQSGYDPKAEKDKAKIDALYKTMGKKYAEFTREFPIVFRWSVQTFTFDEKAFRWYLSKHHKPMWKNRKEMMTAQAEYLVSCYINTVGRREAHPSRIQEYRKQIVEKLHKETEEFESASKEAQEQYKQNTASNTEALRRALRDAAVLAKAGKVLTDAPARTFADQAAAAAENN